MIKLRIRVPDHPDSIVSVEGDELTIGRNPECDAVIPEAYVSAWHAKLVCGLAVADMDSTNGVWVEGERISGTSVMLGKRFQLGPSAEISPQIEILEAHGADQADPAILLGLEQENERLRQRCAELEAELLEHARPEADGSGTLMMAMPKKPSGKTTIAGATPAPRDVQPPEPERPQPPEPAPQTPAEPAPAEPVAEEPLARPMPAVQPGRGAQGGDLASRAGLLGMIERLVREDVGEEQPVIDGPIEEFFTLESFRLLRQFEKVITRLAREFNQLYDMNTMLPDTAGNFRSFAAEVLLDPDGSEPRQKLVTYLEEIRRWLGVTLAANRKAAQRFVAELKTDLSAEQLTSKQGVPIWRKATGGQGQVLWERAQRYLSKLDDELIEDRLDDFAKEFAIKIMDAKP